MSDDDVSTPKRAVPFAQRRIGAETILTLVAGVLAGVTGVFVGTHSILITVIAVGAAIALTAMLLFSRG